MTWDAAATALAEPLERFDDLHAATVRRFGPRAVDLSFANPRTRRDPRGYEALRDVVRAIEPDDLQYKPFGGGTVQRRVVAASLARSTGVAFGAPDVFLTPGGSAALHVALDASFRLGDEVVVPVPCWLDHPLYLRRRGVLPVPVPLDGRKHLDVDAIDAAWGPRTAGVLLSHPACPTGVVHTAAELAALAELLAERGRASRRPPVLVSDEVHRDVVWSDAGFTSAAAAYPDTVTIYSFGKAWSMQGQRVGYVALSPVRHDRDATAARVRRSLRTSGHYAPTSVMQQVAARLAPLRADCSRLAADQRHVRDALAARGYEVVDADATAFVYARCPAGCDDVAFVRRLAGRGLLAMPSSLFHESGYFRLALNGSRDVLDRALEILGEDR